MWDFVFGQQLFSRKVAHDEDTADKNQFAWMVALLGPPPEALLADSGPSTRCQNFGSVKGGVPNETLELVLAFLWDVVKRP